MIRAAIRPWQRIREGPGDEQGGDGSRLLRLLPWDHAENHRRHRDVHRGHDDDREDDRARHGAHRVLDLLRDVADLVVAAVAVHGENRGGPEPGEEIRVVLVRRRSASRRPGRGRT